ncbi:MAG: 4Fe-4S binding protein, partial [Candidatus Bathyarchaeia archaeon]
MNKREFLYRILGNLSLKKPEKPILVPEGLKEFGSIECNLSECIGCKRCMEVCPEEAIDFVDKFDLSSVLKD